MRLPHPVRRLPSAALLAASALALAACGGSTPDDAASSIVRSTTSVAGAGVLGNARDAALACGPTAAVDPAGVTGTVRRVVHAAGETEVPADPQRIVVLDGGGLDTVCALGLQDRLVGAAGPLPTYLGPAVAGVENVGDPQQPDLDRITALQPDLVLMGTTTSSGGTYQQLTTIAPTVPDARDATGWKDNAVLAGTALGRGAEVRRLLAEYQTTAADTGRALDAVQTQASVVEFTDDSIRLYGPASFPGQVLADAGVQRPTSQRLTGAGNGQFVEIGEPELSQAEGDIVYVAFRGESGREAGVAVMNGDRWLALGAAGDRRVFAVDDDIWMTGNGLVAAHAILDDLEVSLNGYVS